MSSLAYQQSAAAIFYAVLGRSPDATAYDFFGQKLENGSYKSTGDFVKALLNGQEGKIVYGGLSADDSLIKIYTNIYGSAPSANTLSQLKAAGTLEQVAGNLVTNLLAYNGNDAAVLSSQGQFTNKVSTLLFPATTPAAVAGASDAQAIFHVLGALKSPDAVNYWGGVIAQKNQTLNKVADTLVNANKLNSLSNNDFISQIFQGAFERAPTASERSAYLSKIANGESRGDLVVDLINTLRGTVSSSDQVAQQHFNNATHVFGQGELPPSLYTEQTAAIYLAVPGRGVDANGLDTWSKYLYDGKSNSDLLNKLLNSKEFQAKGAQLTGTEYIQHVIQLIYGAPATAAQLAKYSPLQGDKIALTAALINDLRTSTAIDNTTVSQQHAFEAAIGNSLLYKTTASVTTSATGGNATSNINNGQSHVLSNAETAVLQNVTLNANSANTVNLKFADNLANLTVNGTAASTVNLSNNGVNKGVAITANNGNVILNASSGDDIVTVTAAANIATATGKFNLDAGNDTLLWAGNNAAGAANTVSTNFTADGGAGIDTISANFITKTTTTVASGLAGLGRTTTIATNANQFTNFERVDLGGYKGKAVTTNLGGTVATQNNTFDWGILNGKATVEGGINTGTINQAPSSTSLGSQGFALSSLATNVVVNNISGAGSNQFAVTGNATAASSVVLNYQANAIGAFALNFVANSSTDVNAGTLALNTSSSGLIGQVALNNINIASGGTGNFSNSVAFAGNNSQVQNVVVTGDHVLNLNLGNGLSNVRDIDASSNTAGLNLTTTHGGTGDGLIVQLLDLLPLSVVTKGLLGPILTTLGLNGYALTVEGSKGNDNFTVVGNTTIKGGTGANTYHLDNSTANAGVTITDFNVAKDTIISSGLKLDNSAGSTIGDYGTRTADVLAGLLGGLVTGLVGGVVGLLSGVLGLKNGDLTAKVGIASVAFGSSTDTYIIIDNNGNHNLDAGDTVIYLKNQDPKALLAQLHYNEITLNGVNNQVVNDVAHA